jgi:hypothetical protein
MPNRGNVFETGIMLPGREPSSNHTMPTEAVCSVTERGQQVIWSLLYFPFVMPNLAGIKTFSP